MKPFWISWYHTEDMGEFELHSPWWVSGYRGSDDAATICAAVQASDDFGARAIISAAYDKKPRDIEWRFIEARPDNWTPFGERFPKAAWMQWP